MDAKENSWLSWDLSNEQKKLGLCRIYGIILHSYLRIIINQYEDPYQPASMMEVGEFFSLLDLFFFLT